MISEVALGVAMAGPDGPLLVVNWSKPFGAIVPKLLVVAVSRIGRPAVELAAP